MDNTDVVTKRLRRRGFRHESTTLHVCGISVAAVAAGMLACALLELVTSNDDTAALAVCGIAAGGVGLLLWRFTESGEPRKSEVFTTVGWAWMITTVVGAAPYVVAGTFATGAVDFIEQVVDSLFESASGFSASGSTVMVDFERPGRGMLMYRQLTQWFGGMGVVVLAVAVLPFLGVGGLDLIAAEAPGPSSDRLTPRVRETARRLWWVYIGLTASAALVLWIAPGPTLYDAVAHALTVASTGGFSPYPESVGYFDSPLIEAVLIVFMVCGGANFALHWRILTGAPGAYWRDSEFRSYVGVLVGASAAVVLLHWLQDGLALSTALRVGVFNAVSLGTSTGYGNATGPGSVGDYVTWASGAQFVLLFLMVVGGCTGSTAGGIKVMRMQVLGIVTLRSVRRVQHSRAVLPVRLGRSTVPEAIVSRMVGFFMLYVLLAVAGILVITALGSDLETSLGGTVSALGNMGPALGAAGPTGNWAAEFSQPARLVLALLMVVGRLEIMTILLMVAPYLRWVGVRVR